MSGEFFVIIKTWGPNAVAPDGKHAYAVNSRFNTVSVIDTGTNMVVATVPVGDIPHGIAITPDGKHAYVANSNSANVSVIDTATNTVVATVMVGIVPYVVAIADVPVREQE
jgi:YVTN family beta-propeller protein